MHPRSLLLASSFLALSFGGASLAEAPGPTPLPAPAPPPAPTRVRPTLDLDGTHIVEMSLYFATPNEGLDTGISLSGFRADGCGFEGRVTSREARGHTTVVTLGVKANATCTPENRNVDTGFTVFLGALKAGHYEARLGNLVLPFDVVRLAEIPDEWAVRLAAAQRYTHVGVHACGMPPYHQDGAYFDIDSFKRDHPDVWAHVLQIAAALYPPSPEEAAARLIATGSVFAVSPRPDGTWSFSFGSSSCCSQTITSGVARIVGGKVVLPEDGALENQTVTKPGCKESDFPV